MNDNPSEPSPRRSVSAFRKRAFVAPQNSPLLRDFIKKAHQVIRVETMGRVMVALVLMALALIVMDVFFGLSGTIRVLSWLALLGVGAVLIFIFGWKPCLLYTSPSPRDS